MNSTWKISQMDEVCSEITDCVNKTAPVVEEVTPYKMIRTTNVKNGRVDVETVRYVTEEVYRKWTRRTKPKRNDIILTREAPLGEIGLVRTNDNIFLGQRLIQYRANPLIMDQLFLYYAFLDSFLQGQIRSLGSGATVEHLRIGDCETLKVKYPPLATQQKIASILSAYDDLIENNSQRIKLLEKMAEEIYKEWFVRLRFPGYKDAKFIDPQGKVVPHGTPGALPEGWEKKGIFDLAYVTYGFPFDSSQFTEDRVGLPVIRIRDIRNNKSKTHSAQAADSKYLVENGDILVGMDGDFHVGIWSGGKAYLNQRVVRFRQKDGISHFFIYKLLQEEIAYLNQIISGTTVAHLGDRDLRKLLLVVPNKKAMEAFIERIDPLVELKINLEVKNQLLQQTRDLLLPRLMSGKLDPGKRPYQVAEETLPLVAEDEVVYQAKGK